RDDGCNRMGPRSMTRLPCPLLRTCPRQGKDQSCHSGKPRDILYTSGMYEETTRGIRLIVKPKYLESQSRPDDDHFVWAYTITIENHGPETVTLRSRYWKITDARGRVQEVKGAGVVGEQPTLKPGQAFEYTSGGDRQ